MSRTARRHGVLGLAFATALVSGCPALDRPAELEPLAGRALFPAYRVQADFTEVATAATVSLIDPLLSETRATSLTDAQGRFRLTFGPHEIEQDKLYFLEAVKGLGGNAVGHDAVRVRTLVQRRKAGWVSLTSAMPGGPLRIDASTTALSVMVSLLQDTQPATPSLLIGKLTPSEIANESEFSSGGTGLSEGAFLSVRALVNAVIASDRDPFEALRLVPDGSYVVKDGALTPPGQTAIAQVSPSVALPGETLVLRGTGFGSTPARNTVVFPPGIQALVTSATPETLRVVVPVGATSGEITLSVEASTATASFTLLPNVSGDLAP